MHVRSLCNYSLTLSKGTVLIDRGSFSWVLYNQMSMITISVIIQPSIRLCSANCSDVHKVEVKGMSEESKKLDLTDLEKAAGGNDGEFGYVDARYVM